MSDVTLGDFYDAIKEGARQGTIEAMKQLFETGNARVQLTGQTMPRYVEEVVIPRQVRTSNVWQYHITPPDGAVGALATVYVYGLTGTFGQNQGVRLELRAGMSNKGLESGSASLYSAATDFRASPGRVSVYAGGGYVGSDKLTVLSAPIYPRIGIVIYVLGTFGPGEGADLEGVVRWIF